MEINAWYGLQVRPRRESCVTEALTGKGYETLMPTFRKFTNNSKWVLEPLFPGYVFCRMTPGATGRMVATRGVMRIVSYGSVPARVDDEEIEAIRVLMRSEVTRQPWRYLPVGCRVVVAGGPLKGIEGVLLSDHDSRRLIISVTMLQRSVAVELDRDTALTVSPHLARGASAGVGMVLSAR